MLKQLRFAALTCFSISVLIYALVMSLDASRAELNSVAALGTAWWTVAVMLFLATLSRSRLVRS